MVAQHAVDRPREVRAHPRHSRDGRVERPEGLPAIVASQNTKVIGETRQQCHAALADYSALKLVRQGKVKVEFTCLPEKTEPRPPRPVVG